MYWLKEAYFTISYYFSAWNGGRFGSIYHRTKLHHTTNQMATSIWKSGFLHNHHQVNIGSSCAIDEWTSLCIRYGKKVSHSQGCHQHEPQNKDRGRQPSRAVGHARPGKVSACGPPPFHRTKNKGIRLKIWHFTAD